jgi:hypothetical protein
LRGQAPECVSTGYNAQRQVSWCCSSRTDFVHNRPAVVGLSHCAAAASNQENRDWAMAETPRAAGWRNAKRPEGQHADYLGEQYRIVAFAVGENCYSLGPVGLGTRSAVHSGVEEACSHLTRSRATRSAASHCPKDWPQLGTSHMRAQSKGHCCHTGRMLGRRQGVHGPHMEGLVGLARRWQGETLCVEGRHGHWNNMCQ